MTTETTRELNSKYWGMVEIILLCFLYLGSSYYLEVEILNESYLHYHFSGWWVAYLLFWSGVLLLLDKLKFYLFGFPLVYDSLGTGSYFLFAGMIQGFSFFLAVIISFFLSLCMGWGFYPFATCEALL